MTAESSTAPRTIERVLTKHPWPSQRRFHGLRARFKGFSGPVGSGKSLALIYEAIRLSVVNPGLLGLIGAPTYKMLRDFTERAFFEVLEEAKIPYTYQKQEHLLTLRDMNSEIIFRSMEDPERLRGTNLAWFGIDEMSYCKEDSWLRLQSRLREPRAAELCGFGVWTPNGRDWVWRTFIKPNPNANPGDLNYTAILSSPGENKEVAATGMYEQLRKSYDERLYRQEVLGEYLNIRSGQAYYAFDPAENVKMLEYDPLYPLCWSLDFNVGHMSSVIGQLVDITDEIDRLWGRQRKQLRILDEIRLEPGTTPAACEAFALKTREYLRGGNYGLKVQVYGDAAGNARQTAMAGAPSDWDAVRKFFAGMAEYKAQMMVRPHDANPFVKDRVSAVNGALKNSAGEHRLLIDPRCKRLIQDLEEVVWTEGGVELDKKTDEKVTHMTDALGYLVNTEFSLGGAHGERRGYLA